MGKYCSVFIFVFVFATSFGQRSVLVMGSSTAAGNGATVLDSAWAYRLQAFFRRNVSAGDPDTVVNNIAVAGYTTYQEMPTGFVAPAGRPAVDGSHNITAAINFHPDVIIINLPTNDVIDGYSQSEILSNFKTMYDAAVGAGIKTYITTSQPRNATINSSTPTTQAQRQQLFDLGQAIITAYPSNYIDFWTPLATTDGLFMIRPEVNADNIHPNNAGHRLLFNQVAQKNIFAVNAPLPLRLVDFSLQRVDDAIALTWKSDLEEPNTSFTVERSADGSTFQSVGQLQAKGGQGVNQYQLSDRHPLAGKSLYRLRINELSGTRYSKTLALILGGSQGSLQRLFVSGGTLIAELSSTQNMTALVRIISVNGVVVSSRTVPVPSTGMTVSLRVNELPTGAYVFEVADQSGVRETRKFFLNK
jgi:lysophospholipase L1-like esterase